MNKSLEESLYFANQLNVEVILHPSSKGKGGGGGGGGGGGVLFHKRSCLMCFC